MRTLAFHQFGRHLLAGLCLSIALLSSFTVAAQDALAPDIVEAFDAQLAQIALQKEDFIELETRAAEFDGLAAEVFNKRGDRLWTEMFHGTLILARAVASQRDDGADVAPYDELVSEELAALPQLAVEKIARLRESVRFPDGILEPDKFVYADQQLRRAVKNVDELYGALIAYVEIAEDFGLDPAEPREYMAVTLADSASNRSVFLELATADADMLRSSASTLPDNANVAEWHQAAQARVRIASESIADIIPLMESVGLQTRQYRRQLLTATGEITTDVLDVGIVAGLVSQWSRTALEIAAKDGPRLIFRLLLVFLIIFVFIQIGKLVQKGVERALSSSRVHISHLLKRMIVSIVRNVFVFIGILLAISQLGISLGPLLAGLGIAGFIIGFALQDSLSNFASGVMILLYRPFDVGDVVEAGGVKGRVSHMSLVNTTFMTLDNQRLVVPNNTIWQSVIINVTAQRTRRVDLVFGISYADDVVKAQEVLEDILANHEMVLSHPEPVVRVHELGDSSVNFVVRPWVNTDDYWEAYWDVTKSVKIRFDSEGISIPFPQRDVHLLQQNPG